MEDALELEVFEIKDGNGGIEMPEVVDAGEDDDEENVTAVEMKGPVEI